MIGPILFFLFVNDLPDTLEALALLIVKMLRHSIYELSKAAFTPLYCAMVLPHLEHATEAKSWNNSISCSIHCRTVPYLCSIGLLSAYTALYRTASALSNVYYACKLVKPYKRRQSLLVRGLWRASAISLNCEALDRDSSLKNSLTTVLTDRKPQTKLGYIRDSGKYTYHLSPSEHLIGSINEFKA